MSDFGPLPSQRLPIPLFQEGSSVTPLDPVVMNELVAWLNALLGARFEYGSKYAVHVAEGGVVLEVPKVQPSSTEGGGGSSVSVYKVTSIANLASDYIAAKPVTFDNSNTATLGTEVNVALPWQLRAAQITTRVPEYAVNDYIVVAEVPDGAGVVVSSAQLTLVDLGIGRVDSADVAVPARFRVKSVQADYLTCRTWDGTTEGGSDVFIAKPPKLRHVASESIEGVTVSYTYTTRTNNNDGQRTAAATGYTSEVQVVMPVWITNDEIFAFKPTRGTDVTKDSAELEWMDMNVDGRDWTALG